MPEDKYSFSYFENQIKQEIIESRKRSIETNQKHNEYVCLIASNFYGSQSDLIKQTGFKTILLEPLFDIESYLNGNVSKNFDLMLHNKITKCTIFIEVKSSFSSIAKLILDFKESVERVKKEFNNTLSKHINLKFEEHNHIEFVLVLPRDQSLQVKQRVIKDAIEDIIIWDVSPITSQSIELKHDILNLEDMLPKKQTHQEENFRKILYQGIKLRSHVKIFNFLLNSDPYQKLSYFIPFLKVCDFRQFNYTELKNKIFDQEQSFSAYSNPEKSKEFIFKEIIKWLKNMESVKIFKQTEDILTDTFELILDWRINENALKREIEKLFFDTLIKSKDLEIKKDAYERYNKYHGQDTLDKIN